MEQRLGNILVAVITAALLGLGGWMFGVFERGSDAATKDLVRGVLQETMVTDSGVTYGAALAQIGLDVNTVSTQVEVLQGDVDDLEDYMQTLASD